MSEIANGYDHCMVTVRQSIPFAAIDSFEADVLGQLGIEFRPSGRDVHLVSHGYKGFHGLTFHCGQLEFAGDASGLAEWITENYPAERRPGWMEALRANCAHLAVTGCESFEVSTAELGFGIADVLRGILAKPESPAKVEHLDIIYVGIRRVYGAEAAEMIAQRVYPGRIVSTTDTSALTAQEAAEDLVTAYDRGGVGDSIDWEDLDDAHRVAVAAVEAEEADV